MSIVWIFSSPHFLSFFERCKTQKNFENFSKIDPKFVSSNFSAFSTDLVKSNFYRFFRFFQRGIRKISQSLPSKSTQSLNDKRQRRGSNVNRRVFRNATILSQAPNHYLQQIVGKWRLPVRNQLDLKFRRMSTDHDRYFWNK